MSSKRENAKLENFIYKKRQACFRRRNYQSGRFYLQKTQQGCQENANLNDSIHEIFLWLFDFGEEPASKEGAKVGDDDGGAGGGAKDVGGD